MEDKIMITDLPVIARHGVLKEETKLGQKFLVSVMIETEFTRAVMNDSLDETLDYGDICHLIKDFMQENTFALIETCAGRLAFKLMMEYKRIDKIEIEVKKPWAPIGIDVGMISVRTKVMRHKAYLSLGSNMGDRDKNIREAVKLLEMDETTRVLKVSDIIETKPYGFTEQPDFLNCVVEIETLLEPKELLGLCNDIEEELKRERIVRWGPRTIDVDIVLYDDIIYYDDDLVIPHRQMHLRRFVLEPLAAVNPYAMNPVLNKSAMTLLKELED